MKKRLSSIFAVIVASSSFAGADSLKTISVRTRDSDQVLSFTFPVPNDVKFGRYGKFLSDDDSFRGEITLLYGSNSNVLDNCGPPDMELERWGKLVMRRKETDSCRVIVERTNRLGTTFRYYGVESLRDKYCPLLNEASGPGSCYFPVLRIGHIGDWISRHGLSNGPRAR